MKIIKVLLSLFYVITLVLLLCLEYLLGYGNSNLSVSSVIYFWLMFGWFSAVATFKLNISFSAIPAFFLFIIGSLFATLGWKSVGETFMRICFIGWIIWISQALKQYKKTKDNSFE